MPSYESHVGWQHHLNNQQKILDYDPDNKNNGIIFYLACIGLYYSNGDWAKHWSKKRKHKISFRHSNRREK